MKRKGGAPGELTEHLCFTQGRAHLALCHFILHPSAFSLCSLLHPSAFVHSVLSCGMDATVDLFQRSQIGHILAAQSLLKKDAVQVG